MKNVSNTYLVLLTDGGDTAHHFRQSTTRNDAVLHVIVRRERAHGAEGALAALPDPLTLGLIRREFHLACVVLLAYRTRDLQCAVRMLLQAFNFNDQHCFSVVRQSHRRAALD